MTKENFAGSSSWSSAYTYETESGTKYFVKVALGRDKSMFEGEALGLRALYGDHFVVGQGNSRCLGARHWAHCAVSS